MRDGPIVVIGDVLLDVDVHGACDRLCPDAPAPVIDCASENDRPGGAGLAALSAAEEASGRAVVLLTALGDDAAGARIRTLLAGSVCTYALPLDGGTPRKVRVHAGGRPMVRLDSGDGRARHDVTVAYGPATTRPATTRPATTGPATTGPATTGPATTGRDDTGPGDTGPGDTGPGAVSVREIVRAAGAVLVSDYGRGMAAHPEVRAALEALPSNVPIVWDPHPKGADPLPGVRLLTPNHDEAAHLAPDPHATEARAGAGGPGVGGLPRPDGRYGGGPDGSGTHRCTRAESDGDAPGRDGGEPGPSNARGKRTGALAERLRGTAARAEALARRWRAAGVSVTLGADGALLSVGDGAPYLVPVRGRTTGDPCGAGDRFAAGATVALAGGALLPEAVAAGVECATAFLAAGGVSSLSEAAPLAGETAASRVDHAGPDDGETIRPDPDGGRLERDVLDLVERVRADGGTVVATGGCFDILHAGHVELLRRARELGDCLIVCLNSDESVRRLKGDGRPLTCERDRARVVRAVEGVDAVVVFGENTPVPLLERLRPDVWVKGGDYAGARLPEAPVVRRLGGQLVVLPYLDGRSTSSIVAAARGWG